MATGPRSRVTAHVVIGAHHEVSVSSLKCIVSGMTNIGLVFIATCGD